VRQFVVMVGCLGNEPIRNSLEFLYSPQASAAPLGGVFLAGYDGSMSEPAKNPYRPQEPIEPPEEPDFQDLDDKPWLRSESREPLIGYTTGLVLFVLLGVCGIAAAGYFFGRRGISIAGFIFLVLLGKASRQ
jgi:hypothetical protein